MDNVEQGMREGHQEEEAAVAMGAQEGVVVGMGGTKAARREAAETQEASSAGTAEATAEGMA